MKIAWIAIVLAALASTLPAAGAENTGSPAPATPNMAAPASHESVVAPGAKPVLLGTKLGFTEGPVKDRDGNVFFTDDVSGNIFRWSVDGTVSVYLEKLNRPAGLAFDRDGSLLVCEKGNHRVISVDAKKNVRVLADTYNGKPFNEPNDAWVDSKGGIYFSDPYYGAAGAMPQDGKHVYYITPDRKKVIRVTTDVVHPNGLIITADGKHLIVADNRGEVKTWIFDIQEDGTLTNKRLRANEGADGLKLDTDGNVYLSMDKVYVYDPAGNKIDEIELPERPHNLCFFGKDNRFLFIAAGASIYSLAMRTKGLY
jgi:gluconolactonase